MRKTTETMAAGLLAFLFWITYSALHGPTQLPDRIPTHFDISGQPNAWGPPGFLWFLPLVATGMYLLLTVLGSIRFRQFNLSVPVTERNLSFLQEQTSVLLGWIKCEILGLLVYLQWSIIQSVRAREVRISPLLVPVFMAVIFATAGWQVARMMRGAKTRAESAEQQNT